MLRTGLWSFVRACVTGLSAAAMAMAPIPAGATAAHRETARSYGPQTRSDFVLVPRDMDALARRMATPMFASSLWSKLYGVLKNVIPGDVLEMAEFTIDYPTDAASVYSHAVAQDYPFFGLVGAAKAMKNQNLPGIGTFTYAKCIFPVAVIDTVFAKADQQVDNAAGKAKTKGTADAAKQYAADYAKAQTQAAKDQVNAQLAENIPYFGEIKTICRFAFETDLQIEKDLKKVVSKTVSDIKRAYDAFSSGDVVSGVSTLMTLGLDAGIACSFVDQAVGGGIIGRTPGLGTLATAACKGFLGAVIDGIRGIIVGGLGVAEKGVKIVYEAGKAAACAVYSLLGGGCSSSPPPPDYGTQMVNGAKAWCAPYGGMNSFMEQAPAGPNGIHGPSRTGHVPPGGPTAVQMTEGAGYRFNCNDGLSACSVEAGIKKCVTGPEVLARRQQQTVRIEEEFQTKLPAWSASFDARWKALCVTSQCKTAIGLHRLNAELKAKQAHGADPLKPYLIITWPLFQDAEKFAANTVEEWRFKAGPDQWAARFEAYWTEVCADQKCRTTIRLYKTGTVLAVRQAHEKNPAASYAAISTPLYAEAANGAHKAAAEAEAASIAKNKETTENASGGWAQLAIGVWTPKCRDQRCVDEVKALAGEMAATAKKLQAEQPDSSSLNVQGQASKQFGPRFKKAVDDSITRENLKKFGGTGPMPQPTPVGRPTRTPMVTPAPAPSPVPVIRPLPSRPVPAPAATPTPAPTAIPTIRRLPLRPVPSPSPTATP